MTGDIDTGVVHADYHTFWLSERMETPSPGPRPTNGLIAPQRGAAEIWTGVHTGDVVVSVEVREAAPADVDLSWDEVVEVDVESVHGGLQVTSLFTNLPRDLAPLTGPGSGRYRVRVHARGRDLAELADNPQLGSEAYHFISWPQTEGQPEHVHKQTDRYGENLRDAVERPASS